MDYMATYPDKVIYLYVSDMILNVHFGASYQMASKIRSRAGGYFFLGSMPKNGNQIILNGNIHVLSALIKLVASSSAEADLAALFPNPQQARIIRLILNKIGHPQHHSHQYTSTTEHALELLINNTQKTFQIESYLCMESILVIRLRGTENFSFR